MRGHSSVGRALRSQRRGRRFDPVWLHHMGRMAERSKAAALNTAGGTARHEGSNPSPPATPPPHHDPRGLSSVGRAFALQAKGRGFDPRRLHHRSPSSSGPGRRPFKPKTAGSNPAGDTTPAVREPCRFTGRKPSGACRSRWRGQARADPRPDVTGSLGRLDARWVGACVQIQGDACSAPPEPTPHHGGVRSEAQDAGLSRRRSRVRIPHAPPHRKSTSPSSSGPG